MRWRIKNSKKNVKYDERFEALVVMNVLRAVDPDSGPYSLVRLVTRRERVIRAMESVLAEPEGSYSVGYCRATSRWLEALKR